MSGITPILDTLLHQVLGKRVDIPLQRDLTEPVRPMAPGEAPRAVHSDSRLDSRAAAARELAGALPRESSSSSPGAQQQGASPASTQTHFSQAARTIADILMQFPAPPSVIRPSAPLMGTADASSAAVAQLAERLQGSIQSSGLFYESHLARWYRGEMSRQSLELEPQVWRTRESRAATSAVASQAAADSARAAPLFTPVLGRAAAPPLSAAPGETPALRQESGASIASASSGQQGERPDAARATAAETSRIAGDSSSPTSRGQASGALEAVERSRGAPRMAAEPLHEALQTVIRHQLELLVSPVLRWEGDVWSGIFMALMIHVPEEFGRQRNSQDAGEEEGEERDQAWRSSLTLALAGLGEIQVDLRLHRDSVTLTLSSGSADAVRRLEEGQERLRERLHARGFTEVALRARHVPEE